jgi:hypothetical protein
MMSGTTGVSPIRDYAQEEADERRYMNEMFCVISCNEDGDTTLDMITRETLLSRLKESYYGQMPIYQLKKGDRVNCGEKIGIYIIKGKSIMPRAKQVVTEWDI